MNNFQTSKEMIAEASAAAVNSAKMNVQQVYQSSTKISLDIFADVSNIKKKKFIPNKYINICSIKTNIYLGSSCYNS